jgi:HK97 family phage major capsid protein
MLKELRDRLKALLEERASIAAKAVDEKRGLSAEEKTLRAAKSDEIEALEERISELEDQEKREARAAEHHAAAGSDKADEKRAGGFTVKDAPIYARGKAETSYFKDLLSVGRGDSAAADRLRRNDAMAGQGGAEVRALTTTAGAGGEFAPPEWLVAEFVRLARAGRKFADSVGHNDLPMGVSSINLPRVATGTSTAVQGNQNTALSQTDLTTNSVSSGISTYGGKQVVSQQLLDQSGIPFDEIILADLAADYARTYDQAVISGSGTSGQLNGVYTYFTASGTVNQTYTSASPTAGLLYSKIAGAIQAVETTRFVAPDTIWMHPRRWADLVRSLDNQGRPLVVPNPGAVGFNTMANGHTDVVEGAVGTLLGLPVVVDANIPTNTGAGTNQDPILVGVRSDLRLWESGLRAEAFRETYADSVGVLFRVYAYSAQIVSRYPSSVSVINGTGLVAPTF